MEPTTARVDLHLRESWGRLLASSAAKTGAGLRFSADFSRAGARAYPGQPAWRDRGPFLLCSARKAVGAHHVARAKKPVPGDNERRQVDSPLPAGGSSFT